MKLLDTFTGIGGFSLAFKNVFLDGEIVGFSEIDKYAIQIYQKHFPGVQALGNITAIQERDLPDFDICTFGFPCQDLSIAGKRKGFSGQRSSLFYEAIRIINEKRPKYFIFENVAGLYSSNKGKDFIQVLQTITDIGYSGQWQMLNTKWFLPQNRERIYFVGHLRENSRPQIFPIEKEISGVTERSDEAANVRCLQAGGHSGGLHSGMTLLRWQNSKDGFVEDEKAGTLRAGQTKRKEQYIINDPSRNKGVIQSDCFPTLRSEAHGNLPCIVTDSIRRLTPTECERLQGYPDGWTEGISDSQKYKCLGNSITVNVAQEIFRRLKNSL